MLIALGFEFVNGFHDTANAVATVIYTHALKPQIAVVWSGCFNLLGVLLSSGAVAFGIVSLLPVELILQVGSSAGYAMVFALLIAAIIWNLGTWWLGLPASSSHTMVGSIVGVGIANALQRGQDGTAGVDWSKVTKIGEALAAVAAVRLRLRGAAAAGDEIPRPRARALHRAGRQHAAAALDSRPADFHLHRRFVLPRLQRRPEGHGAHHADPDRRRPDRLCAEPRAAGIADGGFHHRLRRRLESHRGEGRRLRDPRRSAPRGHGLCARPQDRRGHLSRARRAGEADRRRSEAIRLARQDALSTRCRTSATTCI